MSDTKNTHNNDSATPAIDPQNEQLSAWLDGELESDAAKFLQRRLTNSDQLSDKWDRYNLAGELVRDAQQDIALAPDDFSANVLAAIEHEQQEVLPAETPVANTDESGASALAAVPSAAAAQQKNTVDKAANQRSFWRSGSGLGSLAAMLAVVAVGAALVLPQLTEQTTTPGVLANGSNANGIDAGVALTDDGEQADNASAALESVVRPAGSGFSVTSVSTAGSTNVMANNPAGMTYEGSAELPEYFNDLLLQHNENSPSNQRQAWLPYARMLQDDKEF